MKNIMQTKSIRNIQKEDFFNLQAHFQVLNGALSIFEDFETDYNIFYSENERFSVDDLIKQGFSNFFSQNHFTKLLRPSRYQIFIVTIGNCWFCVKKSRQFIRRASFWSVCLK